MARRRKQEEHENHERWLVSYADFITLLFAFFVVMYSISSVNEGKYRVLSSSLVSAFTQANKSLAPIQYGQKLRDPIIQHKTLRPLSEEKNRIGVDYEVMPTAKEVAQMQKISDEVEFKLRELVKEKLVTINKTNKGVEIDIKSNILFASGEAVLHAKAKQVLREIAVVIKSIENPVTVEGFTDNVPIRTAQFPSNWELSAARSANVVHLFSESGVDPIRLSAVGYGQYQPVADNNTEFGRAQNRRINVVVLNRLPAKRKRLPSLNKHTMQKQSNQVSGSVDLVPDGNRDNKTNPAVDTEVPRKITNNQINREVFSTDTMLPENSDGTPPDFEAGGNGEKKPGIIILPPPTLLPIEKGNDK